MQGILSPRQIVHELAIANAAHDAWLTRWAWMRKVLRHPVGSAQARAEVESSQQWIEHWREKLRNTGEVPSSGLHAR